MASGEYLMLLRDPRWQRKRLETFERDDWKCRGCRATDCNLQVHHKIYERGKMPWEAKNDTLLTLCDSCHKRVTELRRRANELLGDFNLYELPIAIAMLERVISGVRDDQNPVRHLLDEIETERRSLLAGPWTRSASRRIDVLDEETDRIWGRLQG